MKLSYALTGGIVGVAALATLWRGHAPQRAALQIATGPPVTHRLERWQAPRSGSEIQSSRVVVYVAGEVPSPGLYRLPPGSRIDDAIRAAGGFTARGDRLTVDLAEPLTDGEEVLVAPIGAIDPYGTPSRAARSSRSRSRATPRGKRRSRRTARAAFARSDAQPSTPVDVNAASEGDLEQLPGIGPGLAQRIVEFRRLNGPFASPTDLLDVAGMTDRKLDALDALIVLGPGDGGRR